MVETRRVVGVDVGGTFTDLVLLDPGDRERPVRVAKVPTTPSDQSQGVVDAMAAVGAAPATLAAIIHGTTITTNALLERKVARTGLITTMGFRDVLELGRRTRPHPYGMTGVFEPLVARELRLEVPERMDYAGRVLTAVDEAAVAAAASCLRELGCEAVVIHFLHAYANPAHELRAAEIVRGVWSGAHLTLAHALISEYREFERGVTAVVNACVQPVLARYLGALRRRLCGCGFAAELLIMQGNGGTVAAGIAAEAAAKTVMSGPASGVIAAAHIGRHAGFRSLISYDMGGTSSDVALIRDGVPAVTDELELDYAMPIHVPMVDVHTIGAGGGSIARVDQAGILRVGPESAGAVPGPIAYGRGGTRPTITDANLVLGRLDPRGFSGIGGELDPAAVAAVITAEIGRPLSLDATEAAAAILRVANDRMAGAIRMVSTGRGHDPRDYALFAFGGAGPLHATALARELSIPRVLIPARPGVTNAIGCALADLRHDFTRTLNQPLEEITAAAVADVLAEQAADGQATLEREGVAIAGIDLLHSADMQFRGQTHLLNVPLDPARLDRRSLRAAFERAFLERFGIELPELGAMLVNVKTSIIGRRPEIDLALFAMEGERALHLEAAVIANRSVWFDGRWQPTTVYRRELLPLGSTLDGPAIITQLDTTVVIEPGCRAVTDRFGNLVIEVG